MYLDNVRNVGFNMKMIGLGIKKKKVKKFSFFSTKQLRVKNLQTLHYRTDPTFRCLDLPLTNE